MRPRSYSWGLRNRKTYANANASSESVQSIVPVTVTVMVSQFLITLTLVGGGVSLRQVAHSYDQ